MAEAKKEPNHSCALKMTENHQNHRIQPVSDHNKTDGGGKTDTKLIDLNAKPQRIHGQASNNQVTDYLAHPSTPSVPN